MDASIDSGASSSDQIKSPVAFVALVGIAICSIFVIVFVTIFTILQKKKRQSAYDGIRYDKLGTSGDVNGILKSPLQDTKLLISTDDVELNHEKLEQAYDELQGNECELDDDDDEREETRFISKNRSSFYTSFERTWSTINSQIIL